MKRTPLAALALLGLLSGCAPTPCTFADEPLGTLTDWEDAWLEAGGAPESPSFDILTAEDGLALAYRDWVPPGWTGEGPVAVLVPGSSSHSEHYAQLGATLSEDGVYTRILDVRGHGRSVCESATSCDAPDHTPRQPADDGRYYPGRVGDSADSDQLVRDLDRHLTHLHDLWPDASAHLVGHSSGGGLVSRYVENTGASGLASVSLLAPYNHSDQPPKGPVRVTHSAAVIENTVNTRRSPVRHAPIFGSAIAPLAVKLRVIQNPAMGSNTTTIGSAQSIH